MITNPLLQDLEAYKKNNPYQDHNNIDIIKVSEDECRVKVDLKRESMNLMGFVHGGLIYSMADVLCGVHARVAGGRYVTQSSHVNFLRNTTEGTIYCTTSIVKRGRQLVIVHFTVTDDQDRLLADGVIDMMRVKE